MKELRTGEWRTAAAACEHPVDVAMDVQPHDEVIEAALELARQTLGMDAAHLGIFRAAMEELPLTAGDIGRFGLQAGDEVPVQDTFCRRMVDQEIPNVIPDSAAEPGVAGLPVVQDGVLGAYVGVPVSASDGTVFGSFCCLSVAPDPSLADRDIGFMRVLGRLVGDRLQRQALEARERERLQGLVARRTAELEVAQAETAMRLSRAVEFRDDDTGNHIERVAIMAELLARAAGCDPAFCDLIRLAAPLHDVGKVAAPDGVLKKAGGLDAAERAIIERHVEMGHELLDGSSSALLRLAASIARTHHERFDGGGYGRGLTGDQIPIEGRIVAIADVFDALTHDRVYRPALPVAEALSIMRGDHGHFDEALLEVFCAEVVPALPFRLPAEPLGGEPDSPSPPGRP